MRKIIIIDDKNDKSGYPLIESWKNEKVFEYLDLVELGRTPESFFKWDPAGNYCDPLFDINEYAYIFIHHSQRGDSMLPSNIIDLIKIYLGSKLVLFSGNIEENFLNDNNKSLIYRSIRRDQLWNKIKEFIRKSILLDEWTLEILFYDYENILIGKIYEMQDQDKSHYEIMQSSVLRKLLALKYVNIDSAKYNKLLLLRDYEFINELRML